MVIKIDIEEDALRNDLDSFLKALNFSAQKHRHQKRKDSPGSPYIHHPIEVANILWTIGKVEDITTLIAAILHDTLEDTDTTAEHIRTTFGDEVLELVLELSDDNNLSKQERKQNQIAHAPLLSPRAKQIKLADKICNVHDVAYLPPEGWSRHRRIEYLKWAQAVIDGLRGTNESLEKCFDETLAAATDKLARENQ
jgi:guanosine-3',5'-bis(diphosphate) 3'-pyrophosphohydrolase